MYFNPLNILCPPHTPGRVKRDIKKKKKETANQIKKQKRLVQIASERVLNFKYEKSTDPGPCLKLILCFIQANIKFSFLHKDLKHQRE